MPKGPALLIGEDTMPHTMSQSNSDNAGGSSAPPPTSERTGRAE